MFQIYKSKETDLLITYNTYKLHITNEGVQMHAVAMVTDRIKQSSEIKWKIYIEFHASYILGWNVDGIQLWSYGDIY